MNTLAWTCFSPSSYFTLMIISLQSPVSIHHTGLVSAHPSFPEKVFQHASLGRGQALGADLGRPPPHHRVPVRNVGSEDREVMAEGHLLPASVAGRHHRLPTAMRALASVEIVEVPLGPVENPRVDHHAHDKAKEQEPQDRHERQLTHSRAPE